MPTAGQGTTIDMAKAEKGRMKYTLAPTGDPVRDMLFPPHAVPTNPRRKGVIVYNVYERARPLRYEVHRQARLVNGRSIHDPHWIIYDLHFRKRVNTDRNERPMYLEMMALNKLYRREIAMYEQKPIGLLAACLQAQRDFVDFARAAGHLDEARTLLDTPEATLLTGPVASAIVADLLALRRREVIPALAVVRQRLRNAQQALLEHAKKKPKYWEIPLGLPASSSARWRIEGDMLAVVAPLGKDAAPEAACAYVTRRTPHKVYLGLHEGVALAAERAAEILPMLQEEDRTRFDHLLEHGDHGLDKIYTYPDRGRTDRDLQRAIAQRAYRIARWRQVDMSEEMLREAVDYVLEKNAGQRVVDVAD